MAEKDVRVHASEAVGESREPLPWAIEAARKVVEFYQGSSYREDVSILAKIITRHAQAASVPSSPTDELELRAGFQMLFSARSYMRDDAAAEAILAAKSVELLKELRKSRPVSVMQIWKIRLAERDVRYGTTWRELDVVLARPTGVPPTPQKET